MEGHVPLWSSCPAKAPRKPVASSVEIIPKNYIYNYIWEKQQLCK